MIKLLLFIPIISFAALKIENDMVQPVEFNDYSIDQFIEDYAIGYKKTILTSVVSAKNDKNINLKISKPISRDDFEKMFITVLESKGLAVIFENSFTRIIWNRDIRYTAGEFYQSDNYPIDNSYILVVHELKNPLGDEISRNMRPFLSRYGRIISFNDSHTVVISDRGTNISKILEIVDSLDNKKTLNNLINKKKRHSNKSALSQKDSVDLQQEKLEIEKEILNRKIESFKNNKGER